MAVKSEPNSLDCEGVWLETTTGKCISLNGKCNLGRGPENDVVIDSPKASRKHAIIHGQDEGQFWLVDLVSRNGTFRNDRRLHLAPMIARNGLAMITRPKSVHPNTTTTASRNCRIGFGAFVGLLSTCDVGAWLF